MLHAAAVWCGHCYTDSLSTGLPAVDFPPLDPLFVPELLLDYRGNEADVKMIIRNSETRGLKDVDILSFRSVACSSHIEAAETRPVAGSLVACDNQPKSRLTSESCHCQHSREHVLDDWSWEVSSGGSQPMELLSAASV